MNGNCNGGGLTIGDLCTRQVYLAQRAEPLADAAREMFRRHIGALVVVETAGGLAKPVGIVTDRDIVKTLLLRGGHLQDLVVEQAMTPEPLVVRDCDPIDVAIER
jgi:CBS domain-containing protein